MVKRAYPIVMAEAAPPAPDRAAIDRIERALARIEAAAATRAFDEDALRRRHTALRTKVEAAIASLDSLIERQDSD